jgi:carbon-monoxide dehydrogenase medium subunit
MTNARPGLPEFDYIRPAGLEEACRYLADHAGRARPFMGGTDTFVRLRDGVWHDTLLVDVKQLPGMRMIEVDARLGLRLGAAVNMNQVIDHPDIARHYPLLAQAAQSVASFPLRTRATIVGNLCNASPAGDTTGACLVFDGSLEVHRLGGRRDIPLSQFFFGPGKTALAAGEIATALRLPPPPPGAVGRYLKLGRNALSDLAIVGVTALGFPDAAAAAGYRFRIALASVAPVPLRVQAAENLLSEDPISERTIQAAAEAAMAASSPIDDVRGGAEYRRRMVRNLVRQAVTEVWQRLQA